MWLQAVPKAAVASSGPSWGGELARASTVNDPATMVVNASSAVSQNARIVLFVLTGQAAQTMSCSDARGNTYTQHDRRTNGNSIVVTMHSANASTALQLGDAITVTWGNPSYSTRTIVAAYLTGCSALDTNAWSAGYANTANATAVTTADSVSFGIVMGSGTAYTPAWIRSGSQFTSDTETQHIVYTNTVAGTLTMGGSFADYCTHSSMWGAFK
jgi:hypothetical protein